MGKDYYLELEMGINGVVDCGQELGLVSLLNISDIISDKINNMVETGQDRVGQDRTAQNRTGRYRAGQYRTVQGRTGQDRPSGRGKGRADRRSGAATFSSLSTFPSMRTDDEEEEEDDANELLD